VIGIGDVEAFRAGPVDLVAGVVVDREVGRSVGLGRGIGDRSCIQWDGEFGDRLGSGSLQFDRRPALVEALDHDREWHPERNDDQRGDTDDRSGDPGLHGSNR